MDNYNKIRVLSGGLMVKTKLLNDFVKRWGDAQYCNLCGFVLPFGPYDEIQRCCGKQMSKWGNHYSHMDNTKALYKVATR